MENLGLIWNEVTTEERYRLLSDMIEAVYIDLTASCSIVGIQPKPPFYNLFESLRHIPDNKVIIFRAGEKQKEMGSDIVKKPDYAMVETGEALSTSNPPVSTLLKQRRAYTVSFCAVE